jgi:DNA-binding transcriptional LysR family regulator
MLVSFSGRPFGFIDEALATLGRERFVVLTVNQFFTAARVVANANLLTVLPLHFLKITGFADQLVFRPLPFEVSPVLVDAVWHRRNQQRSSHVWLREVVQGAANSAFQQTPIA